MFNLYVAIFLETEYQRRIQSDVWPYPVLDRSRLLVFLLGINPW